MSPSPARNTWRNDGSTAARGGADHRVVEGQVAPAQHPQALAGRDLLDRVDGLVGLGRRRWAGRRCRWRRSPRPAAAKPTTSRRNRSGICNRMPAPSPVLTSLPEAPRCCRLHRAPMPWRHDVVAAQALHVDDEVDPARVVLEGRGRRGPGGAADRGAYVFPGRFPNVSVHSGCRVDAGPAAERCIVAAHNAGRSAIPLGATGSLPACLSRVRVDLLPSSFIEASPSPYHAVRRGRPATGWRPGSPSAARPQGWSGPEARLRAPRAAAWWPGVPSRPIAGAGFRVVGAHTDSPNLRIKPRPELDLGRLAPARRRDLRRGRCSTRGSTATSGCPAGWACAPTRQWPDGSDRPSRHHPGAGTGACACRRLAARVYQRSARPARGRGDLAVLDRERLAEWRGGDHLLRAVIVILLPLQGDLAYSASMTFLRGTTISAAAAAVLVFAVLPSATTFPSLCLALGLGLVPFGFLIALPWRYSFLFTAATVQFRADAQYHKRHEPSTGRSSGMARSRFSPASRWARSPCASSLQSRRKSAPNGFSR